MTEAATTETATTEAAATETATTEAASPEAAAPDAASPDAAAPEAAAPEAAAPEAAATDAAATDAATSDLETPDPAPAAAPEPEGLVELPELDTEETFSAYVDTLVDAVPIYEGMLVEGTVLEIGEDSVSVDIGDDRTGNIDLDEFIMADGSLVTEVGAELIVRIEALHRDGGITLGWEKANKLAVWDRIQGALKSGERLHGTITGRTKGGLTVDVGLRAFLPGSQVDLHASRNIDKFIGKSYEFEVIKFDKRRGNLVVSRRAQLAKEREGLRAVTLEKLQVGAILDGVVKNLTDYGAFVDLGGIDGLLHVTDMSWGRVSHPKHVVKSGQELKVQVLAFDAATEKVSLGLKQLNDDPWTHVDRKYREGQRIEGKVANLTEFGAFVEIEPGVEGLIHISEMSWTKRVNHPGDVLKRGQEIEALILGIDNSTRRISLGLKQTLANPWHDLKDRFPVGAKLHAKIRSVTNFGIFLGIEEGIDGLIHVSDLAWAGNIKDPREHYKEGDGLDAVVLNIDPDAQRMSLGVKQLSQDPWDNLESRFPIGAIVEGKVTKILEFGAIVQLDEHIEALVHISEFSEERVEKVSDVVKLDQVIKAKVISMVPEQRKMGLSIKRLIEQENIGDLAEYSNAESSTRTTIGDLIKEKLDISSLPPGPAPEDKES